MAIAIGDIQNAQTCCRMVQMALDDVSGCVSTFKIRKPGAIEAMRSPTNTAGVGQVDVNDPGGKNKIVDLLYWQNPRVAAGTDCTPDICTPGTNNPQLAARVNADLCRSVPLTLDPEAFRDFCGDGVQTSDFARQQTRALMNQLLAGIDQDAVTFLAANLGQFGGGVVGPLNITLLNQNQAPNVGGIVAIQQSFTDIEAEGTPFLIGQGLLDTYTRLSAMSCCNDSGINIGDQGQDFNYFRESRVDTTLAGQNNIIAWTPGAVQMVSRVTYVGDYEDLRSDFQMKTTVSVNLGGVPLNLDFTIQKDFCGDNNDGQSDWLLTWIARFGFWTAPTDLEAAGSYFRDVNCILQFQADCDTVDCSDVPS